MTSPINGVGGGISTSNGTTPSTWDPASNNSSSTSLNGSATNLQQHLNYFNPNYFNSSFGSTNPYPNDLPYHWQWNAAAAAASAASTTDPRFSKLNVPNATTQFNSSFMSLAAASMAGNAIRNNRRRRNLFSQNQVNELKRAFETEPYVKPETREKLAARTGLTPQQVKIWFQNNRYKCKQKSKEDERSMNRASHSFNDSGSTGSPSSSGNELSMTATNSPDIKQSILGNNDNSNTMMPMIPMVHTQDPSADVKPLYQHPDFSAQYAYPMPAFPYSGYNPSFHQMYNTPADIYSPLFNKTQ